MPPQGKIIFERGQQWSREQATFEKLIFNQPSHHNTFKSTMGRIGSINPPC